MSGFSNFELTIFHFLSLLGYIFIWTVISDYLISRIRLFLAKLRNKNTMYVFNAKDEKISCVLGVVIPLIVFAFHVTFIVTKPMLFSAELHSFFLIYSTVGILLTMLFLIIFIIEDNREIKRLDTEIEQLRRQLDSTLNMEKNNER